MEIRFDDLWKICNACGGTGKADTRTVSSGGFGAVELASGDCKTCDGQGGVMTDSGNAILQFVQKLRSKSLIS